MDDEIQGILELLQNPDSFKEFSNDRFKATDLDKNGLIDINELEKALININKEIG
jgi:hypothetical protein